MKTWRMTNSLPKLETVEAGQPDKQRLQMRVAKIGRRSPIFIGIFATNGTAGRFDLYSMVVNECTIWQSLGCNHN
jgi:hypothetical protein